MLRLRTAPKPDPEGALSPVYLAGRREWNERYGSYISRERWWRLTAVGSLGVAGIAVAGVVYLASQSRIVPYVVQTDKLGDAVAVRRADIAAPADTRLIQAQLARWVVDCRSVFTDAAAERSQVLEAFAMVNGQDTAARDLKDWFAHNDPFARARDVDVTVEVRSVQPISGNTWRIEWRETATGRNAGGSQTVQDWQATVTISVNPPTTDAAIIANPIGLYVDSYFWSQRT